jgi:hypothetical protein
MTPFLFWLFRFFTFMGYAYVGAVFFFYYYCYSTRERAFYVLFVVCV